jgi:phenylacetate-CoA ligase
MGATALDGLRHAARTVPAYRAFLGEHGIDDAMSVRALDDVPTMTKANYLDRWPLAERLAGGRLNGAHVISRSSGSSGRSRTWPRATDECAVGADLYEPLLRDALRSDRRDVLCIVAFAMGTWIAGTYTAAALATLAERGLRICVATPGIVVEEIVDLLVDVAPQFDATLILGYPPFVRIALTQALAAGVDIHSLDVSCAYSGEAVTERFRDDIAGLLGRPGEPRRMLGVYGAADIGLIGTESCACVALRRSLASNPALRAELAGDEASLPTFFVTDERHRHVEAHSGKLLYTVGGAMPLVRYELGDGGTIVDGRLARRRTGLPLPERIIGLRGREDVCAMFYGVNLYAEQF